MKRHVMMSILCIWIALGLLLVLPLGAEEKKADGDKVQPCCEKPCCPVCKTPLTKDQTQFKSEYKGKTIYFASAKCKAEFDKTPEKYMKACETAVVYVCPMKVCNVKTDKPGKCPKCGMDLKKVEVAVEVYVCPMKVCNVKTDKPGKCPKCGMDLKKVDAPASCCSKK